MSAVRGLQNYISKNAATRSRVDLNELRYRPTKRRPRLRLLCDFSPVVDWLMSAYDAYLVETGQLSPYALLYGGDVKFYGQRIVAFVRALKHVGVLPIFFADGGSPGANVEHFETQFPQLRSRHDRLLERCAAVHQVCEGNGDMLQVRWQLGEDARAEITACLQAAGVSLEFCPRGTTAEMIEYQREHSAVIGVLSTNTDFAIAAESTLYPLDFFDLENNLGLRSANICPTPTSLVCECVNSSLLCQSLRLHDERILINTSVLCGNQFTASLNKAGELCKKLGLASNSFECVARWVAGLDPDEWHLFSQELCSNAAYHDAVTQSFELYGYSKREGEDDDGLPVSVKEKFTDKNCVILKVKMKVMCDLAPIVNGVYWRWPVLEPVSLGQPCFSDLTLRLRKKVYSALRARTVCEYGRTSSKTFTRVLVKSEGHDGIDVNGWSDTQRLVLLFRLITDSSVNVTFESMREEAASLASELDDELLPLLPSVVLACGCLCFMSLITSSQTGHQQELQALLMTCLFCCASISPHLIAERPSSRVVAIAMRFSHTLHQARLLASALTLGNALPPPSALFYPMAYIPHHMASQVLVVEGPTSSNLREAYHNYQWVLRKPPMTQLFEEITTNWRSPNLQLLLSLFAGSTHYIQTHQSLLFRGSRLPPHHLLLNFNYQVTTEEEMCVDEHDFNTEYDDDLSDPEVTEGSGNLPVTPKSDQDWNEMTSSQDHISLDDIQYLSSQDLGELVGGGERGEVGEGVESEPGDDGEYVEVRGESVDVETADSVCSDKPQVECSLMNSEPQAESQSSISESFEGEEDITLRPPSPSSSSCSSSYSYSYSSSSSSSSSQSDPTPPPSSLPGFQRQHSSDLPIAAHRHRLLELIEENRVVCVEGETGCGKSTRVPQYILDHALSLSPPQECRVLVTQPRRMAAIKLAERVAAERRERLGVTVGYCVGGDHTMSSGIAITYCTTGYLLQALVHHPDMVNKYTHIILDEIHERSTDADFTLLVVRELLVTRGSTTKLVIMSATMQCPLVVNYLKCHFASVAGPYFVGAKHYGVDTYFIDELDQIPPNQSTWHESQMVAAQTLHQLAAERPVVSLKTAMNARPCVSAFTQEVCTEVVISQAHLGESILVFLPGYHEIAHYFEYLQNEITRRSVASHFRIFILHSQVPLEDQKDAFIDPPRNVAHVILATNIAESSITLPKLRVVINFGIYRRLQYDSKRHISCLVKSWCSRASCEQRAGRAGRVFVGTVVHLFTRQFHDVVLSAYDPPEILTAPIAKLVLQAKQIGLMIGCPRPSVFLSQAIEPPSLQQLEAALQDLARVGAIESYPGMEIDEEAPITYLGHFSLSLPVDLDLSRVVLYGVLFGCAADAVVIAASMSLTQDVLSLPSRMVMKDEKEFQQSLARSYKNRSDLDAQTYSDAVMVRNLFKKWLAYRSEDGRQGCSKYTLARRFSGLHACRWDRLLQLELVTIKIAEKTLNHIPTSTAAHRALQKLVSLYTIQPLNKTTPSDPVSENISFDVDFCGDEDVLRAMLAASYPHQLLFGVRQCESLNGQEKVASLAMLKLMENSKLDVSRTLVITSYKKSSRDAVKRLTEIAVPGRVCQITSFGPTSLVTLNYTFETNPLTSLMRNLNVIPADPESSSPHNDKQLISATLPPELVLLWQFGERRPEWKAGDTGITFCRPQHPLATTWVRMTKDKERVQMLSWRNPTGFVCEVDRGRKPLPFLAVAGHLQGFSRRANVSASNISLLPSLHSGRNAIIAALTFQPLTTKVAALVDHVTHNIVGVDINSFTLSPLPHDHYLDPLDIENINKFRKIVSHVFTSHFTSSQLSADILSEVPRLLSNLLAYGRGPHINPQRSSEHEGVVKWEKILDARREVLECGESDSEEEEGEDGDQGSAVTYQFLPPFQCSILEHFQKISAELLDATEGMSGGGASVTHSDTDGESKGDFKLSPNAPEFVPTGIPDDETSDIEDHHSDAHLSSTDPPTEVPDTIPVVPAVNLPLPTPLQPDLALSRLLKPQFLSYVANLPLHQQQNIREHIAGVWKELLPKSSSGQANNWPTTTQCNRSEHVYSCEPSQSENLEKRLEERKKRIVASSSPAVPPARLGESSKFVPPPSVIPGTPPRPPVSIAVPVAAVNGKLTGQFPTPSPPTPLSPDHLHSSGAVTLQFPHPYPTAPVPQTHLRSSYSGGVATGLPPLCPSLTAALKPGGMPRKMSSNKPFLQPREVAPTLFYSNFGRVPLLDNLQSKLDLSSRAPGAHLTSTGGGRYQSRFPALPSLPPLSILSPPSRARGSENIVSPGFMAACSPTTPPRGLGNSRKRVSHDPLPRRSHLTGPLHKLPFHHPSLSTPPHLLARHRVLWSGLADFIDDYLQHHGHWAELRTLLDKYLRSKGLPSNTPLSCDLMAVCKGRFTMRQSPNRGIIIELIKAPNQDQRCEEVTARGSPEGHAETAETQPPPIHREEVTNKADVREKESLPQSHAAVISPEGGGCLDITSGGLPTHVNTSECSSVVHSSTDQPSETCTPVLMNREIHVIAATGDQPSNDEEPLTEPSEDQSGTVEKPVVLPSEYQSGTVEEPLTAQSEDQPAAVEEPLTAQSEDQPAAVEEPLTAQSEDQPATVEEPPTAQSEDQPAATVQSEDQPAAVEEPPTAQSEDQSGTVEDPLTAQSEDQPAAVEEPLTAQSEDRPAAVEEPPTAQSEDRPAAVEEPPTAQSEDRPAAVEEPPTAQSEGRPAAVEEPPTAQSEGQPAAVEEPPTAQSEDQPAAVEEPPTAQSEDQPAAVEDPPTAQSEDQPAAVEEPLTAQSEDQPAAVEEPLTAQSEDQPAAVEEPPTAQSEDQPAAVEEPLTAQSEDQPAAVEEPPTAQSEDQPAAVEEPLTADIATSDTNDGGEEDTWKNGATNGEDVFDNQTAELCDVEITAICADVTAECGDIIAEDGGAVEDGVVSKPTPVGRPDQSANIEWEGGKAENSPTNAAASTMTESQVMIDFFVACLKLVGGHSHVKKLAVAYRVAYDANKYIEVEFFLSRPDLFRVKVNCVHLIEIVDLKQAGVHPVKLSNKIVKIMKLCSERCVVSGRNIVIRGHVSIHSFDPGTRARGKYRELKSGGELSDSERQRRERSHTPRYRRRSYRLRRKSPPHFPKDVESETDPGHICHILKFYRDFFNTRTEPISYSDLLGEYVSATNLPSDFYLPSDLLKSHFAVYRGEDSKRYISPLDKDSTSPPPVAIEGSTGGRRTTRRKSERVTAGVDKATPEDQQQRLPRDKTRTKSTSKPKTKSASDPSLKVIESPPLSPSQVKSPTDPGHISHILNYFTVFFEGRRSPVLYSELLNKYLEEFNLPVNFAILPKLLGKEFCFHVEKGLKYINRRLRVGQDSVAAESDKQEPAAKKSSTSPQTEPRRASSGVSVEKAAERGRRDKHVETERWPTVFRGPCDVKCPDDPGHYNHILKFYNDLFAECQEPLPVRNFSLRYIIHYNLPLGFRIPREWWRTKFRFYRSADGAVYICPWSWQWDPRLRIAAPVAPVDHDDTPIATEVWGEEEEEEKGRADIVSVPNQITDECVQEDGDELPGREEAGGGECGEGSENGAMGSGEGEIGGGEENSPGTGREKMQREGSEVPSEPHPLHENWPTNLALESGPPSQQDADLGVLENDLPPQCDPLPGELKGDPLLFQGELKSDPHLQGELESGPLPRGKSKSDPHLQRESKSQPHLWEESGSYSSPQLDGQPLSL